MVRPSEKEKMKITNITVRTKKELEAKTKEYRNNAYMIITFTTDFVELEKGSEIVAIERKRRTK